MMKIFKSLAIITAVVAIAGGGTYAWQLQQETISGITYSAGSMDLMIDQNPSPGTADWVNGFSTNLFDKNGLKPGSNGSQIIDIKGEKDAKASIRLSLDSNKENVAISPELGAGDSVDNGDWDGELAQNMMVKISYSADNSSTFIEKYNFTLADYHNNPNLLDLGAITSTSGIASIQLEWSIPSNTTNKIMTDSVGINVIFGLE